MFHFGERWFPPWHWLDEYPLSWSWSQDPLQSLSYIVRPWYKYHPPLSLILKEHDAIQYHYVHGSAPPLQLLDKGCALYHRPVLRLLYEYMRLQDPKSRETKQLTDTIVTAVTRHIKVGNSFSLSPRKEILVVYSTLPAVGPTVEGGPGPAETGCV